MVRRDVAGARRGERLMAEPGTADEALLGRASWMFDRELGLHIPCCSVVGADSRPCGAGPLTGEEIDSGDCGEHGEPG